MNHDDAVAGTAIEALIGAAARLEADLDEVLGELRLSRLSYLLLDATDDAGGSVSQRDLTARVDRSPGTVSARLTRLEGLGLVTRSGGDDRRISIISLTDDARRLLEAARPAYRARAARLLEVLPGPVGDSVVDAARRWLQYFEPAEGDAPLLGIAVVGPGTANRMRRSVGLPARTGALVIRVQPNSPAHRAGLSSGDLIESVNGTAVETTSDLHRLIRAEERWELGVVRGAEEHRIVARAA